MLPQPSWKWLLPRASLRHGSQPPRSARSCLPRMESLGDRIMLSADPNIVVEGSVTSSDVLVALLKGQVPVVGDELAALKAAGAATLADSSLNLTYFKFSDALGKLDEALFDMGDIVIKAAAADKASPSEITVTKDLDKASAKLLQAESSVSDVAGKFGLTGENDLSVALNKLGTDTNALADQLVGLAAKISGESSDAKHKDEVFVLQLSDEFQRLDADIIKIGTDQAIARKAGKGQQEFLEVTLNQVFVTSAKLDDPATQKVVIGLADQSVSLLSDGGGITLV